MSFRIASIVSVLLLLVTINVAQDGGSTQRLDFPSGRTSTRVKGAVDLMNPDAYVLTLRAGQRLTVKLKGNGVLVRLLSPTNRIEVQDNQRFDRTVTETGDYRIVVHCFAPKQLHYAFDVRVQ